MSASYEVTGGAVVLRTPTNSSQYLYRGAVIDGSGFTKESVDHALAIGLIEERKAPKASNSKAAPEPYKGVSVADLKAELDKRNEGREDDAKIVPAEPGNRPEIVAALVADDEKQS
jgi:hypothetical protein